MWPRYRNPPVVTIVPLPARGRPPQAAARRAGLEFVEKLLPTKLTSMDTTERDVVMLLLDLRPDPPGYWRAMAIRRRSSGVMRWSASSASSPRSIWTQRTRPVKALSLGP